MAMMMKKTVEDIPVKGKRVIVRVDFNVPLDKKTGAITDDKRIQGALPTIRYLTGQGAKVILVSHLGRPKNGPEAKFSLKPVAERLAELLGQPVVLAADVIGDDARAKAAALAEGDVMVLENVRSIKKKPATILFSPANWPASPTFSLMMLSALPTVLMPQQPGLLISCLLSAAC